MHLVCVLAPTIRALGCKDLPAGVRGVFVGLGSAGRDEDAGGVGKFGGANKHSAGKGAQNVALVLALLNNPRILVALGVFLFAKQDGKDVWHIDHGILDSGEVCVIGKVLDPAYVAVTEEPPAGLVVIG